MGGYYYGVYFRPGEVGLGRVLEGHRPADDTLIKAVSIRRNDLTRGFVMESLLCGMSVGRSVVGKGESHGLAPNTKYLVELGDGFKFHVTCSSEGVHFGFKTGEQ